MSSVLIIIAFLSFLVLVLTYISRRKPESLGEPSLPVVTLTQPYQGLFAVPSAEIAAEISSEEAARQAEELRTSLLKRAADGDFTVLPEASGDIALYNEVLDVLTNRALSEVETSGVTNQLDELADFISRSNELRANLPIAKAVLEQWQKAPSSRAVAKTLHLTALADNAAIYQTAVKAVHQEWRAGSLAPLSATELYKVVDSQYWVISPDARGSGAGFVLKEFLAVVRRALIAP